jgi:PAS domain S-box-containing protein
MEGDRIKVLMVEDDAVDRMAFERLIRNEKLEFDYACADSVEEGHRVLATQEFDVVLMDYSLGDGTALDLFPDIPEDVPIIIVTGTGHEEIAVQAMKAGAADYLIKDVDGNYLKILPVTLRNALRAKWAEKALRESEQRYRLLTQNSLTGIYIQQDGCFAFVNNRFSEIMGHPVEELLGKRFWEFVHPDDRGRVIGAHLAMLYGEPTPTEYEYRVVGRDGATKWVEALIAAITYVGRPAQMGNVADITERKRVQKELFEKMKTIDTLYEHLVQSGKAKAIAEHTATVAHELRQPLTIIGGLAHRMARICASRGNSDESEKECFEIIIKEVRRLEKILEGLIDFTRRETVNVRNVNPNTLIEYVLRINEAKISERNLSLHVDLCREIEEIPLDPDRFEQVVRNLVSNAIESSPPGEVVDVETGFSLPSEKARETGELDSDAYFEFKIRNRGRIIPPDELGKIFNPFFTTKDYGTGLGLTLSKKIVEDHKGSISVKSDEHGTVFTVWLPINRCDRSPQK